MPRVHIEATYPLARDVVSVTGQLRMRTMERAITSGAPAVRGSPQDAVLSGPALHAEFLQSITACSSASDAGRDS